MKCKAHAVGRWSEVSHAPQGIEPSHSTGCLGHINANLVGIKNNPDGGNPTGLIKAGNDLLSRGGSIIGAAGLTAEFGMGSGVAPLLWSPASDHLSQRQDNRAIKYDRSNIEPSFKATCCPQGEASNAENIAI